VKACQIVATLAVFSGSMRVAQAAAAPVEVGVEGCEVALASELRRLISVELAAARDSGAHITPGDLSIVCGVSDAEIVVFDVGAQRLTQRRVDLSQVEPPARARVIAITAAELLRAAPPTTPERSPRAVEPVRRAIPSRATSYAIGLGPSLLSFATGTGPFFGGALLSRVDLVPSAALEASASVSGAEHRLTGGRAQLLLGHASAGAAWRAMRQWPDLSLFAGLRLGWVRGRGQPDDPDITLARTVSLPWAGPVLGIDVRWWPSILGAGIRAEAGYTVVSAYGRVDRARQVELQGAFVSVTALLALGT
jgi:hypothetical protein